MSDANLNPPCSSASSGEHETTRPTVATTRTNDAYPNEVCAAGGLTGALWDHFRVEPVLADGMATNELYVWPDFMKSRYRITVTFDPEEAADVR